jgi:hypothetical protein
MTTQTSARPVGDLIGGLASDISNLFHSEMELARSEASEKLGSAMAGIELMLVGAVIGIGAVVVLFAAIVSVLAAAFVANGMDATLANFISALIVFVVAAIVAWALVARARQVFSTQSLKFDRVSHSLARDAAAVREGAMMRDNGGTRESTAARERM